MAGTPWEGIFSLITQQKQLAADKENKLIDTLKSEKSSGGSGSGGGNSGDAMADKLLDLLGKKGPSADDHSSDMDRMMAQNQAEIGKLDEYGNNNFGSKQLPKKNYGLNLGNQYQNLGE